ncbi:MAG: T9SS type A sorting domain-containing protein [Bacteroidia bacterium]|nr:T9SS type A sorting domain-containing protein [Bacteroidia bacterium]
MKVTVALSLIILLSTNVYSQSFFSITPDFGGDKGEGKIFNIIPLENNIKVIGAIHVDTVPGFDGGTWQTLNTFSYDGELLETKILIDSSYSRGFTYFKRRIAFKNDSICYIYDRRNLNGPSLNSYLFELNYLTGQILRSKIIYDTISSFIGFAPNDVSVDTDGNIFLFNVFDSFAPTPQMLTVLNSNFRVVHQSLLENYNRDNITKYTETDSNGNIVMLGVSLGTPTSVWWESKLFKQVIDKNYNTIEFKLAPSSLDQTITGYESYPIIRSKSGDWIFATQVIKATNDCQECWVGIPYIVSVSSDFSKVKWETRLFEGNINSSKPLVFIRSITEVADGYIFLGFSDDELGIKTSGLIGKTSLNGDSLWIKHVIPLTWDTTRAFYFQMNDIKTTPEGNILIGGFVSDGYNQIIVPWLAHMDKDGCMEPGCNIVSTKDQLAEDGQYFAVSPNPATSFISVRSLRNFTENCVLSIYAINGTLAMRKEFTPQADYDYYIDIPKIVTGQYILSIDSPTKGKLFSKKIIIK